MTLNGPRAAVAEVQKSRNSDEAPLARNSGTLERGRDGVSSALHLLMRDNFRYGTEEIDATWTVIRPASRAAARQFH
jgi:hypothetical protein